MAIRLLATLGLWLVLCWPAAATHLVTGNGFGFAVVAPETGVATKFYPHPYSYIRPDPANPLSEGIEAPNFIKSLGWSAPGPSSVDYVADSHIIRLRKAGGTGIFFMPFGLERPALIISSQGAPAWRVKWNALLQSQKAVGEA